MDEIINSDEIIYPVVLPDFLPAVLRSHYPDKPFEIDLSKQPKS